MSIRDFVKKNYHHFNAAALADAAEGYVELLADGGKMFVAMAGAMSTGELGISLAEMIRKDKVHGISCTGANLEEDVFNLVGHKHYYRLPNWRDLTPQDEAKIKKERMYRVTDTLLPESVMTKVEALMVPIWKDAEKNHRRFFPHEYIFQLLEQGSLIKEYQIDPKDSWVMAAQQQEIPIFVPGWEDSTLGNVFAARIIDGTIKDPGIMKGGIEYMIELSKWYKKQESAGFFQIGGGIAGDFPICVVPMFHADLKQKDIPLWAYFCQISDAVTSYGGYSGAMPNEKITWDKLGPDTPSFVIESDASIVAPLIFAYVLDN